MNQRPTDQLEKVLALADSDQEGEALGALRMARRLLERNGLTFGDLAQAARRSSISARPFFFSGAQVHLEAKIEQLQDDLSAHVEQNESLSTQIEFWRRRAFELEQMLNLTQAETARWKEMARDTAERLWDLGQIARAEAAVAEIAIQEDGEAQEPKPQKLKAAG